MQHATEPHRHLSLLRSDNYPVRDLYSSFIILYQPQEHKKGCYYPSHISSNIKGNSRALDKRIVLKKKHKAKLNSFVFWFTGFSFAFNSFLHQNLNAKRLSCCSPLTALVRRLQGVQVNLAYFSGPPKLRLFKRQKSLPKCCLKI